MNWPQKQKTQRDLNQPSRSACCHVSSLLSARRVQKFWWSLFVLVRCTCLGLTFELCPRDSVLRKTTVDSSSLFQLRPKKLFEPREPFRLLSLLAVLDRGLCRITWPPIGERAGRVFRRRVV